MKLLAHYHQPPAGEFLNDLRLKLSPDITLTTTPGQPVPPNTQILIAGRPKREHLLMSPSLHTLIIPWSGLPVETQELMLEFPHIAVHNLHHNAAPVAETTLALLLAAAKYVVPLDRSLRANDWTPRYQPSRALLLEGKTALIIGYGAIGRRVAGLCQQLGMNVLAVKRRPIVHSVDKTLEIHPVSNLASLLPRAHVLLICLPHTSETDGLIGEKELNLLPDDAVLVNTGRGPIVDEAALYHALVDGRLRAAGLDVWYNYPKDEDNRSNTPPSTFPFHTLENVVMSPHRAGASSESNCLRMDHLALMLNYVARGETLPNPVDVKAGY